MFKKRIVLLTIIFAISTIMSVAPFTAYAEEQQNGYRRGVNMACAESTGGSGTTVPGIPGQNYAYVTENAYKYFASKGLDLFRVPFLWERIQPTLRGPLESYNLNGLKNSAHWADKYGGQIILDVHNYNAYFNNPIGGNNVSVEDFIDLWIRLSNEFKNDGRVYAYDLMNEPVNIANVSWEEISQRVVTAIRANGDNKLIYIEGNSWSSSESWPYVNNVDPEIGISRGPWINDPANNIIYSAHCYFDLDGSGSYQRSYDEELALNPNLPNIGVERAIPFIDWCKRYGVRGSFGEFNAPHREDSSDWADPQYDNRWKIVMENFLDKLDDECFEATAWAAGMWWGPQSKLNLYPVDQYAPEFQVDAVMTDVLENHPSDPNAVPVAGEEKPILYSWTLDRIKSSIQIGSSNATMYRWFDSYYNDNWFEDNTGRDGYFRPNYWAIIDLGENYNLTKYIIETDRTNAVRGYNFYGSQNGTDWSLIAPSVTDNTSASAQANFNSGTNVRYVKFQVTNRSQNHSDPVNGWINILKEL